jgi:hypothetical protein
MVRQINNTLIFSDKGIPLGMHGEKNIQMYGGPTSSEPASAA